MNENLAKHSWSVVILRIIMEYIPSVENQKGAITFQRCSVENQKGTSAIDFVQR